MSDKEQRIREVAYFIWQEEGCPEGQVDRHWQSAQAIVEAQDAQGNTDESEQPGDAPGEYRTPLATLTRAPSSEGSR